MHTHICIHVRTRVCMSLCRICMCIYVYTYMYVHISHAHTHTCTHINACTPILTHKHTHVLAHTRAHTHTHVYICTQLLFALVYLWNGFCPAHAHSQTATHCNTQRPRTIRTRLLHDPSAARWHIVSNTHPCRGGFRHVSPRVSAFLTDASC